MAILDSFFRCFGGSKPIEKATTLQPLDLHDDFNAGLVLRSTSDERPIHHTVKIRSFSLLRNLMDRCEVGDFKAGGYRWKLVLCPNGNKKRNVEGHISLYLEMAEEKPIEPDQIVAIDFRLFLLNQKKSNYLVLEDANKKEKKYVFYRTIVGGSAGFDQFLPLEEFTDASNGYLIDDTCEFGAEVFVSKQVRTGKGECLVSMIKDVTKYKRAWSISNFSQLADERYTSNPFFLTDHKYCEWNLRLYPNGNKLGNGSGHISVYVELANLKSLPPGSKILAEFTIQILDQINGKHHSTKACKRWFGASPSTSVWGWAQFIRQDLFSNSEKGLLVSDCCIVETDITICAVELTIG
ncbi:uncharacterized protein LOC133711221 [Rosa rugosa]|uniref:uncharacterized protein LOC133711221 n=1 Tax=Rosa rugosa TaxID=74645 RepID=UPI002B40EDDB|nr:uncharacterized protein LOC133711221 [Rosa rugosa]